VAKSTFWTWFLFENHKRQVHVKFSDIKLEQKQQRKHNLSIQITFIQHLTYVKVISIDNLFVYTTTGAFTKANPHHYLQGRLFARKLFGCHLRVSHLLSTNQRARIYLSFVNNDGAWSKLQNFIEPYYKQDISKLSQISLANAREILVNNFEISLVVLMPNITTKHAITYTNTIQIT